MAKEHYWGKKSKQRLEQVHPDLHRLFDRVLYLCPFDLTVLETKRTIMRQRQLVDAGASWTMDSRHLTGHAGDVAPYINGEVRWDWPLYEIIGKCVKQAAMDLDIPAVWGGDWNVKDGPHIELDREAYPV